MIDKQDLPKNRPQWVKSGELRLDIEQFYAERDRAQSRCDRIMERAADLYCQGRISWKSYIRVQCRLNRWYSVYMANAEERCKYIVP